MSYRDLVKRLGSVTEAKAVDLYQRWRAGELSDREFDALLAALVAQANGRAVTIADLSLAAAVTVALGRPVPPQGLIPPDGDQERLTKASATLRGTDGDDTDTAGRVGRLGRSEPLTTAQTAFGVAMASSPVVAGWTRGLSGDPCELCISWAEGGRTFPANAEMATHKGCTCVAQPTT